MRTKFFFIFLLSILFSMNPAHLYASTDSLAIKQINAILRKANNFLGVKLDSSFIYGYSGLTKSVSINYELGIQTASHILGTAYLYESEPDSGLYYLKKALNYAEKLGDKQAAADASFNIGYIYDDMDKFREAYDYYNISFDYYKKLKDTLGLGGYYLNMSVLYERLNEFQKSMEYLLNAQKFSLAAKDTETLAFVETNIADKYTQTGDYKKAEKHFKESLFLSRKEGAFSNIGDVMFIFSEMYRKKKDYIKALAYMDSASAYYILAQNDYAKNAADISKAEILIDMREFNKAYEFLKKALEYKFKLPSDLADAYRLLAKIEHFRGKNNNAEKFIKKALVYKLSADNLEITRDCYKILYQIKEEQKKFKDALSYYKKYSVFRDSIEVLDARKKGLNYEKIKELKLKEDKLKLLEHQKRIRQLELEKQKIIKNYFIAGVAFLFAVLIIGMFQYLKIRKLNKSLELVNEQKEEFLRILSHDVKNSLGAIMNFSDLIVSQIDELSREDIKLSADEIHNSAIVTNNLLTNFLEWSVSLTGDGEFGRKNEPLKDILLESKAGILPSLRIKNIKCMINMNDNLVVYANRDSIAAIVRNLCTNAIKFSPENSEIIITAKKKDEFAEITVEDSGIGISEEDLRIIFDRRKRNSTPGTRNEKGTGLGLSLVHKYVKKNGGDIRVESKLGAGSKFIFTIPIAKD